jgi:non-specific serine/threonine protein kinase
MTLTGVGGAGKTRLALELARRVLSEFPDGVFLAELASLTDAALVAPQVAAALGMNVQGFEGRSAVMEELGRYLEPRRVLVLLDDCEHLVGAAAELAETILARCPRVVVVATSREPLGISGERPWRVPSLSLPRPEATSIEALAATDAVTLLCQRARAVNPDFALIPANAAAIAQICWRLDGIPLALELAAARLALLTPQEVANRLDDRFRLLSVGARTALPRHQTLRAAVDWSYHLLSADEQAVLRRLSVFPAGFSVDAAEAAAADGTVVLAGDVLGRLGALVDKSLVVVEHVGDEARFRLLETIRTYAAERLADTGESEAVRRRHRDFYLSLADATHDDLSFWWDTHRWLARVRIDDDNFRAALAWSRAAGEPDACLRLAVALSYYWVLAGTPDGATWLEWSLGATDASGPARVRGLACHAFFLLERGDEPPATKLLNDARSLADAIDDPTGAGLASQFLGVLHYGRGDFDEAATLLHEARRRFEHERCTAGTWGCHYDLGWLAVALGDHDHAADEFERALAIGRSTGSEDLIAHSLAALAPVVARSGDAGRAESLAAEAVAVTQGLSLRLFGVMALVRSAEAAIVLNRTNATTFLLQALTILQDVGGRAWLADTLELVAVQTAGNAPQPAARLFGTVDGLAGPSGGRPSVRAIRAEIDQCRIAVENALGAASFRREFTIGLATPTREALNDAMEVLSREQTQDR